jgi:POT family proton-dependent oligopeptide transporter
MQFIMTRHYLTAAISDHRLNSDPLAWSPVVLLGLIAASVAALAMTGRITINASVVAKATSWLIALLALGCFVYLIFFAGLSRIERNRVYVMVALFVASTVYYAGQEQAGTSLTLFAERYTDRYFLGWQIPAGVFQGISCLYILMFAPLFSALWLALGRRGKDLSMPVKFAVGLMLMGLGFLVMYVACIFVLQGQKVLPTWLALCYMVQMWGDLCLAPVGLSSMTKLAAPRFVGQVMGVWFLSVALGNNLAGQLATEYDSSDLASLPALFLKILGWGVVGGVVMLILTPRLKRLAAGVQ